MSELRWILLAIGVLVVAAIYLLWGRNLGWRSQKNAGDDFSAPERKEPGFSGDEPAGSRFTTNDPQEEPKPAASADDALSPGTPWASPDESTVKKAGDSGSARLADDEAADKAQGPQKIIVLHVAGRGSVHFSGEEVVAALQAEGMQLGKYEIFHRLDAASSRTLFSAASMVEPGTFDLSRLDEISMPGISLFLVLPGPADGAEAFSEMLITARNLAQRLGAEVLDEQGSSLSNQTAGHIREQILSFQLQLRSMEDVRA
ncbi:MAG: cell division protein ZipA [Gammaproteobacteria bacterium]|nr:cell division protein ZipA [Gammaproteobacteria bacterium]